MTTRSKTRKRRQQRSAARRKAKKAAQPLPVLDTTEWLSKWAAACGLENNEEVHSER